MCQGSVNLPKPMRFSKAAVTSRVFVVMGGSSVSTDGGNCYKHNKLDWKVGKPSAWKRSLSLPGALGPSLLVWLCHPYGWWHSAAHFTECALLCVCLGTVPAQHILFTQRFVSRTSQVPNHSCLDQALP